MDVAVAGRRFPVNLEFDAPSYFGPVSSRNAQERINHCRVELGSTMFADFAAGLGVGHGTAIGPVASNGIIGIGNGEHSGGDVNRLTREAVWIARSVEFLMMLTDDKSRRRKEIDVTDDFQTKTYMVLH